MSDRLKDPSESASFGLPQELISYTKLFKEPVVAVSTSYRSGSHPVLKVRIAAEVSRSPKMGLLDTLMQEGRRLWLSRKTRTSLIKFLAADELLRKYGDLLAPQGCDEIRRELAFIKIQAYLLSDQIEEAARILKSLNYHGSTYLDHRHYSQHYGIDSLQWDMLATQLQESFHVAPSGTTFTLLGYATVMGTRPEKVSTLSRELSYTPHAGDDIAQPWLCYHQYLIDNAKKASIPWLPENLAIRFRVAALDKTANLAILGSAHPLTPAERHELSLRIGLEVIDIPLTENQLATLTITPQQERRTA